MGGIAQSEHVLVTAIIDAIMTSVVSGGFPAGECSAAGLQGERGHGLEGDQQALLGVSTNGKSYQEIETRL